ncbi:hypothetical protein BDV95DRAFT_496680 [Massariosphaeria phaeospora]|uniref:Uncharacterized protein n=1 Tax=Massariosphaeria phaeospora TaxID=100035 RepID=A0A7C8I420_9PLEO|nr:hypothetical protein BDV95DRAFT_496680 [Massariosphaeria phaeospora]
MSDATLLPAPAPASAPASQAATPRAASESLQHPQLKAAKDKNCPFCRQSFTSSSLGRHLDLYIRPKNPKPSDGVHLVDDIRKIRGSITRRQPKGPPPRESGTPTSTHRHSVTGEDESPAVAASPVPHDDRDDRDDRLVVLKPRARQQFKEVSWGGRASASASTSNTPTRTLGAKTPDPRRDVSRQLQKAELDQRQRSLDDSDTARATEMALRELLKSVREANAKVSGPALFEFDPYTLNFPSLCLRILPPPSTLFAAAPFPTNESWSISPPGQKQLEALNRQVRERLLAHQRQKQINQAYPSGPPSVASSAADSPLPTPPLFDPDPQKLFCHIADAFSHWIRQPEQVRHDHWQIEILRSYARANDLRREAELNLENARREIEHLKANRWTAAPPELSPFSFSLGTETVKELGKHGIDFRNWDYDRLIDKWRNIVRDTKNASVAGMAAQKPLPQSARSLSMASIPAPSFATVNPRRPTVKVETVPYSAPPPPTGGEPSSDQVDAEGEDDDGDIDLTTERPPELHGVEHQLHGLPVQPTPIHPAQLHAHVQAQAHAQAQAWAAARQHMNQSRNQHHHQHQQLSPHPSHMGSAANSRRASGVLMDAHNMNPGGMLPMEGLQDHQDQFMRMDMGLGNGFVGSNDGV